MSSFDSYYNNQPRQYIFFQIIETTVIYLVNFALIMLIGVFREINKM